MDICELMAKVARGFCLWHAFDLSILFLFRLRDKELCLSVKFIVFSSEWKVNRTTQRQQRNIHLFTPALRTLVVVALMLTCIRRESDKNHCQVNGQEAPMRALDSWSLIWTSASKWIELILVSFWTKQHMRQLLFSHGSSASSSPKASGGSVLSQ